MVPISQWAFKICKQVFLHTFLYRCANNYCIVCQTVCQKTQLFYKLWGRRSFFMDLCPESDQHKILFRYRITKDEGWSSVLLRYKSLTVLPAADDFHHWLILRLYLLIRLRFKGHGWFVCQQYAQFLWAWLRVGERLTKEYILLQRWITWWRMPAPCAILVFEIY